MTTGKLIYCDPRPMDRREAEIAFASRDPKTMADALVNVSFHDPDWFWVQEKCLELAGSDVAGVRQIAVTCLGHLARIHKRLDLERVLPVLDDLSGDPEVHTQDALDDIRMFISGAARLHR